MANTAAIQLFSPLFFHLKTRAVTPPISAPMPTSNRKHASAKTPLLPLAISNTVTRSEPARIISRKRSKRQTLGLALLTTCHLDANLQPLCLGDLQVFAHYVTWPLVPNTRSKYLQIGRASCRER